MTNAGAGITAASATAITSDELIDLIHAVDPAYRNSPNTAMMMNDSTLKAVRKLKDSQNRYLGKSEAMQPICLKQFWATQWL